LIFTGKTSANKKWRGVNKTGPDSFQRYSVSEQHIMFKNTKIYFHSEHGQAPNSSPTEHADCLWAEQKTFQAQLDTVLGSLLQADPALNEGLNQKNLPRCLSTSPILNHFSH